MKKLFLLVATVLLFSVAANAQLVTSRSFVRAERPHNVWLDFGFGKVNAKGGGESSSGTEIDINLRWTVPFGNYFAWDILNVGPSIWTGGGDKGVALSLMTGPRLRYELADRLYAYIADNFGLGVVGGAGLMNELSLGVTWRRLNAGVYFRRYPSFSAIKIDSAFNSESYTVKSSSLGVKLGFAF